jgi:hypothetical protein
MGDTRPVGATECVVGHWVALLRIRDIAGLDLGTKTGYYDRIPISLLLRYLLFGVKQSE